MIETNWMPISITLLLMLLALHVHPDSVEPCKKAGCARCSNPNCMADVLKEYTCIEGTGVQPETCADGGEKFYYNDKQCDFGCKILKRLKPGILTSPKYPNWYGNNLNVTYFITAPDNHHVILIFLEFNIEPDKQGVFGDYLEIFRGNFETSVGKFGGAPKVKRLNIYSKYVSARFITDDQGNKNGFKIEYVFEDDSHFVASAATGEKQGANLRIAIVGITMTTGLTLSVILAAYIMTLLKKRAVENEQQPSTQISRELIKTGGNEDADVKP